MADLLLIVVSAALVNNFVLVNYLGLCPFFGVSKNRKHLFGLSAAICLILPVSVLITTPLRQWLLPLGQLDFLFPLMAIVVVAISVQLTEIVMRSKFPLMYASLGIYLPLITPNCAILGVILLARNQQAGLLGSLAQAIGAALGFVLVLYIFCFLREEIDQQRVPRFARGLPIALVTAGILALAFSGFSGIGT